MASVDESDPARADHEASQVVVWWRFHHRVGDEAFDRDLFVVSIEPDNQRGGSFNAGNVERLIASGIGGYPQIEGRLEYNIAGPVADALRGSASSKAVKDKTEAARLAHERHPDDPSAADEYLERIRSDVQGYLQRSEIRQRVDRLAALLIRRRTLGFDDVAAVLEEPSDVIGPLASLG